MRLIRGLLSTAFHQQKPCEADRCLGGVAAGPKTVRACRFQSLQATKPKRFRPSILRRKVARLDLSKGRSPSPATLTPWRLPTLALESLGAFEFDEHGRGRGLPARTPIDLAHGRRFLWVHLVLSNARSRDLIATQSPNSPAATDVFLSSASHPRLEWEADELWGSLEDLQLEIEGPADETTDVRFVLTPRFLMTGRRHPVLSAQEVKRRVESGEIFEESVALFERMLTATADSVGEMAHKIGAALRRRRESGAVWRLAQRKRKAPQVEALHLATGPADPCDLERPVPSRATPGGTRA